MSFPPRPLLMAPPVLNFRVYGHKEKSGRAFTPELYLLLYVQHRTCDSFRKKSWIFRDVKDGEETRKPGWYFV